MKISKEIKQAKHILLIKVLNCLQHKYKDILKGLESIKRFIGDLKKGKSEEKKKKVDLELSSMPKIKMIDENDIEWKRKRVEFIEKN